MTKQVLFVSGVMRSGTTLLHRVITHSCKSEYVREVDAFRIIVESFKVLDQHQEYRPLDRTAYVHLYRQFISSIFSTCANKMYGGTLALKDPQALKHLNVMYELMPETKFLLSVRNPLATVTSIYRVRNRQRQQGKKSFISDMNFGDIVNYAENLCNIIVAMHSKNNVCTVRYEDLVARNFRAIDKISAFVGFDIDLDIPDTSQEYDPEHAFWTPESGGTILQSSLQKYQNELTEDQIDLVSNRFSDFKRNFGYNGY